jgi:hypothetical protein
MIKNFKRTMVLVFAALIFSAITSCKKSTYYQLTDEEMAWLVYKNNDILRFENQYGDLLRYYVTIRVKSYDKDGDTYSEFTSANFLQLNDTTALFADDSRGQHLMEKGADGFLVTLTWPHFPIKKVPLTGRVPSMLTLGGINYNDVFVLDGSLFTDIRFYNKKLWVSQSQGVIQIEDTFGNIWIRKFN